VALDHQTGRRDFASTAEAVAAVRALGANEPDAAVRGPDHLAAKLLPPGTRLVRLMTVKALHRPVKAALERRSPGLYWFEIGRTRLMDEVLLDEVADGAAQVVLLGAGFDSRPYRFEIELRDTAVFEVDHPDMAAIKRERVTAVFGKLPEHVSYVAVDFDTDDLGERLAAAGYDPGARTIFIWSGVVPYLTQAGVDATLRFVREGSAPGSAVLFDYAFSDAVAGDFDRYYGARQSILGASRVGEPFKTGIEPGTIEPWLAERGLELGAHFGPGDSDRFLVASDGQLAGRAYDWGGCALARVPDPAL
jgi:methyltransferase (TIGR00027 family)